MKKNLMFAMFGAIALTGAVGLSSCTDEEVAEVNPNYNPETGEVLTNFVFNVSTDVQGTTRMAPAAVQIGSNTFRGIQNAVILTYKMVGDGKYVTDPSTRNDKEYDLNQLIGAKVLDPADAAKPASRRVLEMSLPTGTNTLLLWGRAIKSSPSSETDNVDAREGKITFSPNSTLSAASFLTDFCLTTDEKTALAEYEVLIVNAINKIVKASVSVNVTRGGKTVNKTMAWSDYVTFNVDGTLEAKAYDPSTYIKDDPSTTEVDEGYQVNMSPLGQILANLFVQLNSFKEEELRNGEGKIIAAIYKDVYDVLGTVKDATATTVEEDAAQAIATAVRNDINLFFEINSTSGLWSWKAISTVKTNEGYTTEEQLQAVIHATGDLNKFPDGLFHLPPGATVMKYLALNEDKTVRNEYAFMTSVPTYAMGSSGGSFNPNNYIYPAELCYFGNSPIRVTDQEHVVTDYPDGPAYWDDDAEWVTGKHNNTVDWAKNSHVLSSTRSVAMQDNINYGTALLKSMVKFADGINVLKDNNSGLHSGERDQEITNLSGIELTGFLIGGQVREVGWNYLPKTADFNYMVYDDQLPSGAIPTTSSPNYTLVWDNWNESTYTSGTDQNKVYVAVQFLNNTGVDFWGMNNIIRNGSTFYIVGELDPDRIPSGFTIPAGETNAGTALSQSVEADRILYKSNKSWGITWPTNYALPPYAASDGSRIKQRRVFIQDYMTSATFVISTNSLKSALVSVPDLRSSQQSLGLSVDLVWRPGLEFDKVPLGTE